MKFFRKIIYLVLLIAAARALSMQPGEQPQSTIDVNEAPDVPFFSVVPSLKQTAQLYIIKQMLINPGLINSFQKANIPQELKSLVTVAKFAACMLSLKEDEDLADLVLLDFAFSRTAIADLKEDKKPKMILAVNCVRHYAKNVFSDSQLTNLWILLLNDVQFHTMLPGGKEQVLDLFVPTYAQLLAKNRIQILYRLFTSYPQLRRSILDFLLTLLAMRANNIDEYINRNTLPPQPEDSTIDVRFVANEELAIKYKNGLFNDIRKFFQTVTTQEIDDHSLIFDKIIEELYKSPEVLGAGDLLQLLAQKGANLNAPLVLGYSVPVYIFGERGPELFGNVTENLKQPYQDFLITLLRNGLDITELQNVQQPIDINAPVPENQTPLQTAQRNYQIAVQNDPAFKVAIENAQREYVQNKIKQESRGKN